MSKEARLQIVFTQVVGSYANLFEKNKVFIWEKSRIPTGFLLWYTNMAGVSLFCTPIWRPWCLLKSTWPIPSHLGSRLNRTLGQKRPIINFPPCSRQKLYKYRHPFLRVICSVRKRTGKHSFVPYHDQESPGIWEGGWFKYVSKIQLVVYYQCCVLIGWATTRLFVIAHCTGILAAKKD